MSTDRELLELAAKAAGYKSAEYIEPAGLWAQIYEGNCWGYWNPITDDGDALRLAVKLGIKFRWHQVLNQALAWLPADLAEIQVNGEDHGNDALTATRRAIVRAASAIGESMP